MSDDKQRSDRPATKGGLEGPAGAAHATNPSVTYEQIDINIANILYFCAGLTATVVVCWFVVWGSFVGFDAAFHPEKRTMFPLAGAERRRLPDGEYRLPSGVPLEQVQRMGEKIKEPYSENVSAARFKAAQAKSQAPGLDDYGWVDEKQGVVHVPIDVAMTQVVAKYGKPVDKMPEAPYLPPPPVTTPDGDTVPKAGKAEKADEKPKADDKPKADEKPKAEDTKPAKPEPGAKKAGPEKTK